MEKLMEKFNKLKEDGKITEIYENVGFKLKNGKVYIFEKNGKGICDSCGEIGEIYKSYSNYGFTEADTIIFLDEPWTMADKLQAEDRCHRIGTKTSVNIITLLCKNTIDERIHELITSKGELSDMLVDKKKDIKFLLSN